MDHNWAPKSWWRAVALCDREQRTAARFATVDGNGGVASVENYMLLILGAVIASVAMVIIPRMRVPGGVNGSALGWMSEQWLAEHRASQSA